MADFDFDAYFALRAQQADARIDRLRAASERKQQHLAQTTPDTSWVHQLGLDPRGLAGGAVNLAANLVEGAVNVEKNIGTSVHAARAMAAGPVDDQVKIARQREQAGIATPADKALLDLPAGDTRHDPGLTSYQRQARLDALGSNRDRIAAMENALRDAATVRDMMDVSSIVQRDAQQGLVRDLSAGYRKNSAQIEQGAQAFKQGEHLSGATDVVSGLAGLLGTIGSAAVNNKQAAIEYVTNNLPQLVLAAEGGAGMALTNIPYAVDEFAKGIDAYQKRNGGALPPQAELQKMGLQAASLAAAETVGDKLTLGGGKLLKGEAQAITRSFKDKLRNNGIIRAGAAVAEGGSGEFATEAYQTAMENAIEGKPVTAEDAFVGGAIGAIVGGTVSGGVHIAQEKAAPATPAAVTSTPEQRAARKAAQVTGDVSALSDPKSPTYAPTAALDVLLAQQADPEVSPEQKQVQLQQASKIATDLQQRLAAVDAALSAATPQGRAQQQAELDQVRQEAAQANDQAEKERLTLLASLLEEDLATPADTQSVAKFTEERGRLAKQLATVHEKLSTLQAQPLREDNVDRLVEQVQSGDAQAGERLLVLSMAAPERLAPEVARQLADAAGTGLTAAQRSTLRAFSEARVAENALKDGNRVSRDIYYGSAPDAKQPFVGLAQYRQRTLAALQAGQSAQAERQLRQLQRFAQDHMAKAKAAAAGIQAGLGTQIQKTVDGSWRIVRRGDKDYLRSDSAVQANGGHTLNSPKMVQSFAQEARAAKAVLQELRLLQQSYSAPTAGVTSSEATDVQNPPERQSAAPAAVDTIADRPADQAEAAAARPASAATNTTSTVAQTAARYRAYLDNPPADYTTARAQQIADWARRQYDRIGTMLQTEQDPDAAAQLEEQRGELKLLAAQASDTVAADATLVEQGLEDAAVPVAEDSAQPTETAQPSTPGAALDDGATTTPTEEATANTVTAAPVLSVMAQTSVPDTPYLKRNLVADFFRIVTKRGDNASVRPLTAVRNFLSAWNADPALPYQYLGLTGQPSEFVQAALADVQQRLQQWLPMLQENLAWSEAREDFRQHDMMQYLLQANPDDPTGKPVTDQNVLTAIGYASYDALLRMATSPVNLTEEQINGLFGRDKDELIPRSSVADLQTLLSTEAQLIASLGKTAVQVLGLKPKKAAPQDLLPRLETALGTHAYQLLVRQGVLETVPLSSLEIAELLTGEGIPTATQQALQKLGIPASVALVTALQQEGKKPSRLVRDTAAAAGIPLTASLFKQLQVIARKVPSGRPTNFVRLARVQQGRRAVLAEPVKALLTEIRTANVKTGGIVDRLFGSEGAPRYASTAPQRFVQRFAQGTQQLVPRLMRKVIEQTMATPHYVVPEMLGVLLGIGDDAFLRIAGARDLEDHHEANWASIEAQNDNLRNQLDMARDMLDNPDNPDGIRSAFYVVQSVWRNFRAGFTTQSLNQQTSKIHRYLFARPAWTVRVDPADTESLLDLKIALATNFGEHTENATTREAAAAMWDQLLESNPDIDALLQDMAQVDLTTHAWSAATAKQLVKVATNYEGMATLQALVAAAKWRAAKGAPFDVTLLVGADGKTNGPMLTHLALGAARDVDSLYAVLNRGGMYSTDDGQPANYGEYIQQPLGMDLYQSLAKSMLLRAKQMMVPKAQITALHKQKRYKEAFARFTPEAWDAVEVITKPLLKTDKGGTTLTSAARNLVKTPLTAFGFGSSLANAANGMANAFLESIYTAIEDLHTGRRGDLTTEQLITAINTLIEFGNYKAKPLPMQPLDNLMRLQDGQQGLLSPQQEAAVRAAFNRVLGNALKQEMQSQYEVFIERRRQLNQTIQGAFRAYQVSYTALRLAERERLMRAGEIASRIDANGKQVPLHDLTVEQEQALRERHKALLPTMHTDYSLREGKDGNLDAALYMAKRDTGKSADALLESKVWLGRSTTNSQGKEVRYQTTPAMVTVETDPGAAGTPYSIHSSDSANIYKAMAKVLQSLTVHDEISNAIDRIAAAAAAINGATVDTFLHYSPAREATNTFERIVLQLAALVEQGQLGAEQVKQVFAGWADTLNFGVPDDQKIDPRQAGQQMLDITFANAQRADTLRLQAMAKMATMDQYPWRGGEFRDLKAVRTKAQTLLQAVPLTAPEALQQAITRLTHMVEDGEATAAPVTAVPASLQTAQAENQIDPAATPVMATAWGAVGKPAIASDPQWVGFFQANPDATAAEVVQELQERLQPANNRTDQFQQRLLSRLRATVALSLPVRFITPATAFDALAVPEQPARAWYAATHDAHAVYVLSPEFTHSGLTTETLLHELVHASVARTIAQPDADVKPLVAELEQLRQAAIAHVAANDVQGYGDALGSVQEFVAWGMTSPAFQRDVLGAIRMESKTAGNRLVTALQGFIRTVARILFAGSSKSAQEQAASGISVLMANVAGLFAAAEDTRQSRPDQAMVLSMAAAQTPRSYTTTQLYEALASSAVQSVPAGFDAQLRGLLDGIVSKLHGPLGTFKELMADTLVSPLDLWLKAQAEGHAPFASTIQASGFAVPDPIAFVMEQVEATVRTALTAADVPARTAYGQLARLYKDVTAAYRGKPQVFYAGNWATATRVEQQQAQALHDFLFAIDAAADGKSDYLARFAALGLAHPQVHQLLQTALPTKAKVAPQSFADRLQHWFVSVLEFFQQKITHTYTGQPAGEQLATLASQLVGIEAKRRHTLMLQAAKGDTLLGSAEQAVRDLSEGAKKKLEQWAGADWIRDSGNAFVRASGGAARTVLGNRVDTFFDALQTLRDRAGKERHNMMTSLFNELRGFRFETLLRMTKNNERIRKHVITQASAATLEAFAEGGRNLSNAAKAAVTAVFLRSGAHALLHHGMPGIERILADTAVRNREITAIERQLAAVYGGALANQAIEYANVLGHYKATGLVKGFLFMNTHLMAAMTNTPEAAKISTEQAQQAQPLLEQLVALYAIDDGSGMQRQQALEVLRQENQRGADNGVQFLLQLQRKLERDSRQRLFKDNPALMVHGYTPEILNPHTRFVITDEDEGAVLEAHGYVKGGQVGRAPWDPAATPQYLYVQRDGGLAPYLSGVLSLTGMQAKGSKRHNGYLGLSTQQGIDNVQLQAALTAGALRQARQAGRSGRRNLDAVDATYPAPVFNEQGKIVNWRYLMAEQTKDTLLERDSRFDQVIGALAGSIYDKEVSQQQNRSAIEAVHALWRQEINSKPESYVLVGRDASDPELREIWDMLPDAAQQDIRRVWGLDGMWVPTDAVNTLFGYRKYSLAQIVQKDPQARSHLEQLFARTAEMLFGQKAALQITKGERAWQEVIREMKDLIVVKTGVVMMGNIWSNLSLLWLSGVSTKEMLAHHTVALKGAIAYQRDLAALDKLKLRRDSGYLTGTALADTELEIRQLQDALARNPVRELVDAGLMPTIVEDVASEDDLYSYKSLAQRKAAHYLDRLPKPARDALRTVYLAHDTPLYQGLSRITQLSDFTARYVLYQHLTQRKKNPLHKEQAIQQASDAFVNYDVPMHRGLQYTDDMGITLFTKYFLRIQKVLLKLSKENPARLLSMLALGHYLDLGPIVMDSSFIHHVGNNPLRWGPLEFPAALTQLSTVAAPMALIQ